MTIERPLSPHLQIYRLPFTAILSIAHRLSGLFLYLGFVFFAWAAIMSKFFPDCAMKCLQCLLTCRVTLFVLFLWTLLFFYHMFNGIRHLFWDVGLGFEIKTANLSGLAVVALAIICNFLIWYCIFY